MAQYGQSVSALAIAFVMAGCSSMSTPGDARLVDAGRLIDAARYDSNQAVDFGRVDATDKRDLLSSMGSQLSTMSVSPKMATIHVGAKVTLAAIGRDTAGDTSGCAASWTSDTPAVATVSPSAMSPAYATSTGVTPGTANITATCDIYSDVAIITVVP